MGPFNHCTCDPGPEGQHRVWCAVMSVDGRPLEPDGVYTVRLFMVGLRPEALRAPWCDASYYQIVSSAEVALRKAEIMRGEALTCLQTLWADGSEYRSPWILIEE